MLVVAASGIRTAIHCAQCELDTVREALCIQSVSLCLCS